MSLEETKKEYEQVIGNVPKNKANDEDWLKNKILDAKEETLKQDVKSLETQIETDANAFNSEQAKLAAQEIEKQSPHIQKAKLQQIPGLLHWDSNKAPIELLIKLESEPKMGVVIPEVDPDYPEKWATATLGNNNWGYIKFFIAREESVPLPKSLYEQVMDTMIRKRPSHQNQVRTLPKELQM